MKRAHILAVAALCLAASSCGPSKDKIENNGIVIDTDMGSGSDVDTTETDADGNGADAGTDGSVPDAGSADMDILAACDPDPCTAPRICAVTGEGEAICVCDQFHTEDPQTGECIRSSCDGNPCMEPNRGICVAGNPGIVCECNVGYIEDPVTGDCVVPAECTATTCTAPNRSVCTVENNVAVCSCDVGYIEDPMTMTCVVDGCMAGDTRTTGACGPWGLGIQEQSCGPDMQWYDSACDDPSSSEVAGAQLTGEWADWGARRIFVGFDSAGGEELYVSDGTAAGTQLLTEFNPGPGGAWSGNAHIHPTPNGVVFPVHAEPSSSGVWVTDGTTAGTTRLKPAEILRFEAGHERALFETRTPILGAPNVYEHAVWATDGSLAGTQELLTFFESVGLAYVSSHPQLQRTIFTLVDASSNYTSFCSDGTAAGTEQLAKVEGPVYGAEYNGQLYFGASAVGSSDYELWSTDCTDAGTTMLGDLRADGSSGPYQLTALAGGLLFTASDTPHGIELWFSDGTGAGSAMVKDLNLGAANSEIRSITSLGNVAVFLHAMNNDPSTPWSLYASDGTAVGTVELLTGLPDLSAPLVVHNQNVYFGHAGQLWATDGTVAGTLAITALPATTRAVGVAGVLANRVVFVESLATASDTALWTTDGTVGGEIRIDAFGTKERAFVSTRSGEASLGNFAFVNTGSLLNSNRETWMVRPQ